MFTPFEKTVGNLYVPLRRLMIDLKQPIPPEEKWPYLRLHRFFDEYAGYSQIFHADDPVLGPAPWHDIVWNHAGGGDSVFHQKWPVANKKRPPFEVVHIGPTETNWYGRVMDYADGRRPEDRAKRQEAMRLLMERVKPGHPLALKG